MLGDLHTCLETYIHALRHTYIHAWRHTYIHAWRHTYMLGDIHTCLDTPDIHTCSQVSDIHTRLAISNIHACLGASNIHTCIHTHYSPVALIKTSLTAHVQSQILATHSITLMNIHCGLSACALSKFPIKSPLLSSYS